LDHFATAIDSTPTEYLGAWDPVHSLWQMWLGYFHDWLDLTIEVVVAPASVVDGSGDIWLYGQGGLYGAYTYPYTFLTDWATVQYHPISGKKAITETVNIYGQRARAWRDPAFDTISFEALDAPSGLWSTPIQPFGANANSPQLQCLDNGSLIAAYIDSTGALKHAVSTDDGVTWTVL
jgi:hypothetical protein